MKLEGYELPARALAAALTHAAKKDVRYYLNAVMLDFRAGRIVGTDGHRLFIGKIPVADFDAALIPRDLAASALKAAKKELSKGYALALSINVGRAIAIKSVFADAEFSADAVEVGRLLEYERVIPRETSGEVAQFNMAYLADTQKALALYSGKDKSRCWPHVSHNGSGPCVVTDGAMTAFCVVMPVRSSADGDEREWFFAPLAKKAA